MLVRQKQKMSAILRFGFSWSEGTMMGEQKHVSVPRTPWRPMLIPCPHLQGMNKK